MVADEINVTTDGTRRTRYISRLSPLLRYLYLVNCSSGSVSLDIGIIAEADARGSFSRKKIKKGPRTTPRGSERASERGREGEREGESERRRERERTSEKGVLIRPGYPAFSSEISQLRSPSSLPCSPTARKSIGIRRSNGFAEGIKDEAGTALLRHPRKHAEE